MAAAPDEENEPISIDGREVCAQICIDSSLVLTFESTHLLIGSDCRDTTKGLLEMCINGASRDTVQAL